MNKLILFVSLVCSICLLTCSRSIFKLDQSGGQEPREEQIALIKEHVTDPERLEKCLAIAEEWKSKIANFHVEYQKHSESIRALQADYYSTKSQFEAAYDLCINSNSKKRAR